MVVIELIEKNHIFFANKENICLLLTHSKENFFISNEQRYNNEQGNRASISIKNISKKCVTCVNLYLQQSSLLCQSKKVKFGFLDVRSDEVFITYLHNRKMSYLIYSSCCYSTNKDHCNYALVEYTFIIVKLLRLFRISSWILQIIF